MSLAAIASITAFVLLERVVQLGSLSGMASGALLVAAGAWMMV